MLSLIRERAMNKGKRLRVRSTRAPASMQSKKSSNVCGVARHVVQLASEKVVGVGTPQIELARVRRGAACRFVGPRSMLNALPSPGPSARASACTRHAANGPSRIMYPSAGSPSFSPKYAAVQTSESRGSAYRSRSRL